MMSSLLSAVEEPSSFVGCAGVTCPFSIVLDGDNRDDQFGEFAEVAVRFALSEWEVGGLREVARWE